MKKVTVTKRILSVCFLITFSWALLSLLSFWDGWLVLLILLFGILFNPLAIITDLPFLLGLIVAALPFCSLLMLFSKKMKTVTIGYISSLTSLFYLFRALISYPIPLYPIVNGKTMALGPYISILLSLTSFVMVSTSLFLVKKFEHYHSQEGQQH